MRGRTGRNFRAWPCPQCDGGKGGATTPKPPIRVARRASLRELHHRVKNNFQVIESLLSLQKRSLPAHQLGDIHFIEDHILSMVVAARIAFTTQQGTFLSVAKLLPDVVDGLGRAVRNFAASVQLKVDLGDARLDLDRSIAFSLYLAAILPPYLRKSSASPSRCASPRHRKATTWSSACRTSRRLFDEPPPLIRRLILAYFAQLGIKDAPVLAAGNYTVAIRMGTPEIGALEESARVALI